MLDTSTVKRYKSVKKLNFWHNVIDCWSLVVGLVITGKNFTRPLITVRYPWKTVDGCALATFRGHIELVQKDDDPTQPKCIMCGMCAKVCPSNCLDLALCKITTDETDKNKASKTIERFIYTYHLCSLCGLCVQTCPARSLQFSGNVYLSGLDRDAFKIDLMARLRNHIYSQKNAAHKLAMTVPDNRPNL
ncbi:4Fe-4S dicluster domain-containing protein [Desulfovibrionales bacterium]